MAIALSPLPVIATPAAQQPQTGGVDVLARDAEQQPLSGHTVQLRNVETGQIAGTGVTNAAGQVSFNAIAPGKTIVELVNPAGHIIGTATLSVAPGAASNIVVTAASGRNASAFSLFGMGPVTTVTVLAAAAALGTAGIIAVRDGKIVICHKPAGQPAVTITISESAWPAHQAHGDTRGACPASPSR